MFSVEKITSEKYIHRASNYYGNPMMYIDFAICPTKTTKTLFKILLEKYNDNTYCSKVLSNDIEGFEDEMDIIRGMSYTLYDLQLFNNEYEESSATYPVIVKTLKLGIEIIIQFDKNFKKFFDKNFEI
jgi:hypothetical protein